MDLQNNLFPESKSLKSPGGRASFTVSLAVT